MEKSDSQTTSFQDLETLGTALRELMHCVIAGPEWFTNGRRGQIGQASMWHDKGMKSIEHLQNNRSPRLIKKLRKAEWEKRHVGGLRSRHG